MLTIDQTACAERWSSSRQPEAIDLTDDDAVAFKIYKSVLTDGRMYPYTFLSAFVYGEAIGDNEESRQAYLATTYILSDKLGDVLTANIIIDHMIEQSCLPGPGVGMLPNTVSLIAQSTVSTPCLRKLAIEYYVHAASMMQMAALLATEDLPGDIVGEMFAEKTRLEIENRDQRVDKVYNVNFAKERCSYHLHDSRYPYCSDFCVVSEPGLEDYWL